MNTPALNSSSPPERLDTRRAQHDDSGIASLYGAALSYHITVDASQLIHELGLVGRKATGTDIAKAAALVGLRAKVLTEAGLQQLPHSPCPAIIRLQSGEYAVIKRGQGNHFRVFFPNSNGVPSLHTLTSIEGMCAGEVILVGRGAPEIIEAATNLRFGIGWFISAAWRYRKPLSQVLIASAFVQLFALVTPLFFQVVIDKVLLHSSSSTLAIIVFGLCTIGLFDVLLQYLRSYALNHTATRLDVELGRKLFEHLLKLPLAYFETRPTGQTIARIREIETIRAFLTGQGLTAFIDVMFLTIFFAVLLLYSTALTVVIFCSIPVYLAVAAVFTPLLRARIKERFLRNADSQQFLIESVVGIQTVKAAAVEPLVRAQWEEKIASYSKTSFQATLLGNAGQNLVQYVNKLTTAGILFFGARSVMAGHMTVGQLVAFNMISAQLVAPIIRLSQLWQDFQQIRISVERLGDIVETPPESQSDVHTNLPQLRGRILFQNISFRYSASAETVLRNINFEIRPGEVIGIVGPSGSGKSTLTKLVQRLYLPDQGKIVIDGTDISLMRPAWLRQQIGVVLQENLLFSRSVHENIAFSAPHLNRDAVVSIAMLAGAHEFICNLPNGYDTHIEERGANLSGGQRQRIAIARALARDPRVLIFDEATSSLDYESERIIQQNMKHIVRGRTVLIIAHRLAAVRHCDRIIGIEAGRIVEEGTHEELLQKEGGLYRRLWSLQNEPMKS